jgi:hypothetical protein
MHGVLLRGSMLCIAELTRVALLLLCAVTLNMLFLAKPCWPKGPSWPNCGKHTGTPPLHYTHGSMSNPVVGLLSAFATAAARTLVYFCGRWRLGILVHCTVQKHAHLIALGGLKMACLLVNSKSCMTKMADSVTRWIIWNCWMLTESPCHLRSSS